MLDSYGLKLPMIADYIAGGSVFFVQSTHALANNNPSYGKNPERPLATFAYAYDLCTASKGDMVVLLPGHAETLTSIVAMDTAGVMVIGVGEGDNRPIITVNAAINGLTITAANQRMHNVKLVTGASYGITTKLFAVTGGAGLFTFSNCHFQVAAATKMYHLGYVLGAKGKMVTFKNCFFENLSTLTMAGNATLQKNAVLVRTGDVDFINCRFHDMGAQSKNKWAACVKCGSTGTGEDLGTVTFTDCLWTCRGVAVTCRAAAVSPRVNIIRGMGISTSSNTDDANIFQTTYALLIDTYVLSEVNKRGEIIPTATAA